MSGNGRISNVEDLAAKDLIQTELGPHCDCMITLVLIEPLVDCLNIGFFLLFFIWVLSGNEVSAPFSKTSTKNAD